MEEFKIKSYGRTELAQLYAPDLTSDAACRKLKRWIKGNPQLRHLWRQDVRSFLPSEVALIVNVLGEP